MTDIEKMIAIAREQDPDTWKKIDDVAAIISPGAFVELPPRLSQAVKTSVEYKRAEARHKAWMILQYVGLIPPLFDWAPVLGEFVKRFGSGLGAQD